MIALRPHRRGNDRGPFELVAVACNSQRPQRNRHAQLEAYLFFDGTCADAMRFYERTLAASSH